MTLAVYKIKKESIFYLLDISKIRGKEYLITILDE